MSDATLLVFGCAVTFIAAMAVYVYLRGDFAAEEQPAQLEPARAELAKAKVGG